MLKLWIKGDQELELEVGNPTVEASNHAVEQAFKLFGASTNATAKVETPQRETPASPAPEQTYVAPPKPAPHAHLKNDTTTQAANMDEAVVEFEEKQTPEHFKTGIKMKNGKPSYRCRYICPKCGTKGNHYIYPNTQKVDCHNCQTTMVVTKSVKGVTLMPDHWNNFYVAGDQQAVLDVTYANQTEKIAILKKNNLLHKDFKGNV